MSGVSISACVRTVAGERELADGMASLALPDERRPRSASRETALEVRYVHEIRGMGEQGGVR